MLTESKASRGGFVPEKKKFPRRRQSLVGHKIKRNARERIEDIACPLPDELFNDDNQCLCSSPSTQSLSPAGHRRLDMLKSSCNDHKQNQKELEQSADHQLDAINSASTQQIHSTISSAIQYSGTSQDTNHIKRGIQVAMVKRMQPCNNINRSGLSLSDPSVFRMNSDVQETDSDTSYVSFSVSLLSNEDGSDCCSHIWDGLVKLTALLIRLGNFAAEHEILAYPLAAIAFYICLGLLQPMIASVIAALTGWVWPPLHFFLASTAGFVWRVADWLYSMDQLGRNMICDMAASYCRHYRLLCDHQCSFVDRAMDGIKTSRNCLG